MQVTPADARKIRDSTLPQGYQGVPELAVYVTQPNPSNIARRESDGLLNVWICACGLRDVALVCERCINILAVLYCIYADQLEDFDISHPHSPTKARRPPPADARKIRDTTLPQVYQGVPELAVNAVKPNSDKIANNTPHTAPPVRLI